MIRRDHPPPLPAFCIALVLLLLTPVPGQAQSEGGEAPGRAAVQEALDRYMEGLIAQDAGRIPLAADVRNLRGAGRLSGDDPGRHRRGGPLP